MNDPNRVQTRPLSVLQTQYVQELKQMGNHFMDRLDSALVECPSDARMIALAKTKVEEAVMWAVKAIT